MEFNVSGLKWSRAQPSVPLAKDGDREFSAFSEVACFDRDFPNFSQPPPPRPNSYSFSTASSRNLSYNPPSPLLPPPLFQAQGFKFSRKTPPFSSLLANPFFSQEDASRFGGQKKVVRRGDKDNHFVGYTYKRKPTVVTRPSMASSGPPQMGLHGVRVDTTTSMSGAGGAAAKAAPGATGGAAAAEVSKTSPASRETSPASGKSSPSSTKSSPRSGSRKSGTKATFAGLFGGRKGA